MNSDVLKNLNIAIASLHESNDVYSYDVDTSRRIKFPRGFLRTLKIYRSYVSFLDNEILINKIAKHLMHRDTLHWIWLKTDIIADAREMLIKFQLVNLASILEAIVKGLYPKTSKKNDNVYYRIDLLAKEKMISNALDLKKLWSSRNSIHLHLTGDNETIDFSDVNYIEWHKSMSILIDELNKYKRYGIQ